MSNTDRILQLAGLNEAKVGRISQTGSFSDMLFSDMGISATDFKTIKKKFKAAEELGMVIDITSDHNESWDDKRGDAIFTSNWLLKLIGKKYYADVEGDYNAEQVFPDSSTKITLRYFAKRDR